MIVGWAGDENRFSTLILFAKIPPVWGFCHAKIYALRILLIFTRDWVNLQNAGYSALRKKWECS
jgi:hypothetical protein